jgi:hypothetical protein
VFPPEASSFECEPSPGGPLTRHAGRPSPWLFAASICADVQIVWVIDNAWSVRGGSAGVLFLTSHKRGTSAKIAIISYALYSIVEGSDFGIYILVWKWVAQCYNRIDTTDNVGTTAESETVNCREKNFVCSVFRNSVCTDLGTDFETAVCRGILGLLNYSFPSRVTWRRKVGWFLWVYNWKGNRCNLY